MTERWNEEKSPVVTYILDQPLPRLAVSFCAHIVKWKYFMLSESCHLREWGAEGALAISPPPHTYTHQFVPYLRKYQRTSKLLTNSWIKMTNGKCFVALEAFPAISDNLNLNISGVACPKFPSHGSCVLIYPTKLDRRDLKRNLLCKITSLPYEFPSMVRFPPKAAILKKLTAEGLALGAQMAFSRKRKRDIIDDSFHRFVYI